MRYLLVLGGDERVYPLRRALRLGRGPDQDVILNDEKQSVSRAHARLELVDGQVFLTDLGSRNGTTVDGAALRAGEQRPLETGALIGLGYHRLRLVDDAPASRPAPAILAETRPMARLQEPVGGVDLAALTPSRRRLHQLFQLCRAVQAERDPAVLLERFLRVVQDIFHPDRAFIGLTDPTLPGWALEASFLQRGRVRGAFRMNPAVLERARREGRAFVLREPAGEGEADAGQPPRLAMCGPVLDATRTLGVLYLDDRDRSAPFDEEDLEYLAFLGMFAGRVLADALDRDLLRRRSEALEAHPALVFGRTPVMADLQRRLPAVAGVGVPVLLLGETGTGKSSFARALHDLSPRRDGPFVKLNCAAIPETLLEAELFGYAPRSGIANADPKGRPGKLELAHGGTLFLDEIGDMPLSQQAKLLTVLEDREVFRLGATKPVPVHFNLVAATAKPLEIEITGKRFREDLYHRLSRVVLTIPPLRERLDDLPELARHILLRLRQEIPRPIRDLSPEALDALRTWSWPGNIRELENCIAQAMIECLEGDLLLASHLPARLRPRTATGVAGVAVRLVKDSLELSDEDRARRDALLSAIRETGSLTKAAKKLGMSKQWAIELSKRLGVRVTRTGGG